MSRRGRPPHPDILTPREWEVLALLRQGLSNPEIAQRLGISPAGARYHVSEILGKLAVESREEAARWRPVEERRPWGTAALLPVAALWRKAGVAWLSPATAAVLGVAVAAGAGLLIWGLVRTGSEGELTTALIDEAGIFDAEGLASSEDEPTRQIPTEAPSSPMPFAMGDTGELRPGLFITVYSFEFPAEFESVLPDDVSAFAVVDVEGCAGSNPPQGVVGIEPIEFRIQRADEFHWHPTSITKEPALQETTLTPNDCVRGYVTFLIQQDAEPAFVLFGGSANLKWAIP